MPEPHLHQSERVGRDRIDPENRERGPLPGHLTFNAPPPDDYEGHIVIFATVRIGDHAHIDVYTGRQNAIQPGQNEPTRHFGHAGRLVFAWDRWVEMRDTLAGEATPQFMVREVENPTARQLEAQP